MSVTPLEQLTVESHPLGHELRISWIEPSTLPSSYRVYLFKMSGQYPTQDQIDDYFENGTTATGLTVFASIHNDAYAYLDYDVINGTYYYYSGVIKDTSSGEYSTALQANATPSFSVTVRVVDWKEIVCAALKKLFKNYNMDVDKDIDIRKHYTLDPNITPPFFTVARQSANDVMRLWGNLLKDESGAQEYGKFEQDSILVIWEDVNSDRRDKLTNIIRANEQTLRRYILKYNAIEVRIEIGSDDIDLRWETRELHTCQMIIQIVFASSIEYDEPELKLPFEDVVHEVVEI